MYDLSDILKECKGKIIILITYFILSIFAIFSHNPLIILFGVMMFFYSLYSGWQLFRDLSLLNVKSISGKCVDIRYKTYKGRITRHIIELEDEYKKIRTYEFNISSAIWEANSEYITVYFLKYSKIILGGEGISKRQHTAFEMIIIAIVFGLLLFLLFIRTVLLFI